jgi:hypothetical protein
MLGITQAIVAPPRRRRAAHRACFSTDGFMAASVEARSSTSTIEESP